MQRIILHGRTCTGLPWWRAFGAAVAQCDLNDDAVAAAFAWLCNAFKKTVKFFKNSFDSLWIVELLRTRQ